MYYDNVYVTQTKIKINGEIVYGGNSVQALSLGAGQPVSVCLCTLEVVAG